MLYFKKLFKLPGPIELGMSDSDNSMASEFFRNNAEEFTWEQYYAKVKELHPIKYFFSCTAPEFFRRLYMKIYYPINHTIYYLKCHMIKKYQYHLLDLRQPKEYEYGWIDSDKQILYACFKILENYIENELSSSYAKQEFTEEELADPATRDCYEHLQECKALYNYWKIKRPNWDKKIRTLSHQAHLARKRMDFKGSEELYKKLFEEERKFDEAETEALCGIIKVRKGMWT